jgi:formate-dependent nitrite reductase membrane component NrfD
MVPEPDFQSYYGRQIIKTPTWKTPDVPLYLFLGGLAGGSALLAEGAALSGSRRLEHLMRGVAAGGAGVGTVFLVHDLGRPERFLNMLRVFKITSPLSVGSYILAPFATFTSAALASQLTGRLPLLGRLAGVGAAAFGPPLAAYTAALFASTAVPIWHEAHRELPFVFVGSGSAAAGGLAMVLTSTEESAPGFRMALAGAGLELTAMQLMERRLGMLAEPDSIGRSGRLMKAARALTLTGIGVSVLGRRSRLLRALAGAAYVAGSVTTRFGVFEGGLQSARDPKYVVIPQRERLAARQAGAAVPPGDSRTDHAVEEQHHPGASV